MTQPMMAYKCTNQDCGAIHEEVPTKEELGFPTRQAACKSKASFATEAEAKKAQAIANSWQYRCGRCGDTNPVIDLHLEVYQCPTQKGDWHLGPPKGPPFHVWGEETEEIVRANWGSKVPWEIAQEINRFLRNRSDLGGCCFFSPATSQLGGGVVYKAWQLGLVPSVEDRDMIRAGCSKLAPKVLNPTCEHGRKFKECGECYFGVAPDTRMKASVMLHHEGSGKALVVQTDDLKAFMTEVEENPQGYVVVAVQPLGKVDPVLWEELGFESENF